VLNHLFVYGTLRKTKSGIVHPYLSKSAVFIDQASIPGKLYQVDTYPGAIPALAQSKYQIYGEVYFLLNPKHVLRVLDEYEECASHFCTPHEYQRLPETATFLDGSRIRAWVYWFRRPIESLRQIKSGDYFDYLP